MVYGPFATGYVENQGKKVTFIDLGDELGLSLPVNRGRIKRFLPKKIAREQTYGMQLLYHPESQLGEKAKDREYWAPLREQLAYYRREARHKS